VDKQRGEDVQEQEAQYDDCCRFENLAHLAKLTPADAGADERARHDLGGGLEVSRKLGIPQREVQGTGADDGADHHAAGYAEPVEDQSDGRSG